MNDSTNLPVVLVQGGFDDLRIIDIRFLQEAANFGKVCILLFQDEIAQEVTGKPVKFPFEERRYYLENIRYVDQVFESTNKNPNSLPIEALIESSDKQQIIWAVPEKEDSTEKKVFCQTHHISYQVISDQALAGFPIDTSPENEPGSHTKVMVSGCFDWVHTGHIRFFEEASAFGDLYVVVGHDENLRLLKGEGHPLFNQDERLYWVQAIRFVKLALISTGNGWLDAAPEIEKIRPDMFIVNKDGDVPEKREYFKELGIEYKILERTPKTGLPARVSTTLRGF